MIDDNDLTADAFENDNKEHLNKEFGRAIVGRNEVLDSGSFGSIADPQYSPLGEYLISAFPFHEFSWI